jgi:hypothetical protein
MRQPRTKDKHKRQTIGYKYRWLELHFEKYKQKIQLFAKDLQEFLNMYNLSGEFSRFVKRKRKERRREQKELDKTSENGIQ